MADSESPRIKPFRQSIKALTTELLKSLNEQLPGPDPVIPGLDLLPPELLAHIFSYLDIPGPSSSRLLERPCDDITYSVTADLKSVSLVSQKLRSSVLRFLFRCARLNLQTANQGGWQGELAAFLDFVKARELSHRVDSLTLINDNRRDNSTAAMERNIPQLGNTWDAIFAVLDPVCLTVVAPPRVLAAVTSLFAPMSDIDYFDMPFHILSLQREREKQATTITADDQTNQLHLHARRPWTSALLNEGPFPRARVFHGDGIARHPPPSILAGLAGESGGDAAVDPFVPLAIDDFTYVAILPPRTHLRTLVELLPQLRRFRAQLVQRGDETRSPRCGRPSPQHSDEHMDIYRMYNALTRALQNSTLWGAFCPLQVVELTDVAADGFVRACMNIFDGVRKTDRAWTYNPDEGVMRRKASK